MQKFNKIIILFVLVIFSGLVHAKNSTSFGNFLLPSAIIAGTTTVCQNAPQPQILFTGSGGTAPYTFTYNINGGASLTAVTTSGNTVSVPVQTTNNGTFIYTLVSVADSSGTQVLSETATVTVTAVPVIDFTFTNDSSCSETTIQFTSTATGTDTYSYLWDFGDGNSSTLKNPNYTYNEVGCGNAIRTVKLTVTNAGCPISISKTINIKQKPNISFVDANNAFDPFNNCANASSNSSFSITVGNTSTSTCISSYAIDWGDGSTQTSVTFPISHIYSSVGAFSMKITGNSSNGCTATKTYVVKNLSNPIGGINSPGTTQNLCAPSTNLQFSISNWGGNSLDTTYRINYGDGSPIVILTQIQLNSSIYYNSTNPLLSVSYPVPHTYNASSCPVPSFELKLDITNACGTTPLILGNITILAKPQANFTAPAAACSNNSIQFTNTTIAGSAQNCVQGAIYTWDFGDGSPTVTTPISLPQNINHTYLNPGTYTVKLTSENFCGLSFKTQTICIETPLAPQFVLNTTTNCTGQVITANNSTLTPNSCSPPAYLWSVTHTPAYCGTSVLTIPNQTTTNATYNFTEPGTYTITLRATNTCGSFSSFQTVTIKKPPTISSVTGINTNYCGPATINPIATVNSCAPASSTLTYAWSFPGGIPSTSNLTNPGPISYSATGNYTVSLIVTNECGASVTSNTSFAINDTPILTNTPLTQTVCSGSATTIVNLTSSPAGATFIWTATATAGVSGFASSGTSTIPVQTIITTNTNPGTVTYTITPSLGGCPGISTIYTINVNPAPKITTQPASSSLCLGGSPAALSLVLTGVIGVPTYQWYSNTTNSNTGGNIISGATSATFTPLSNTAGIFYYYCVINLPSGGCSSISTTVATITILPNAFISLQPTATQNLCVGVTIPSPLTVSYSGGTGTPSYQWFSNTTNTTTGGSIITGANSASYTPPAFTGTGNYYYYVTIALSGTNCLPVTSNAAEIIVFADPTISIQPLPSQTLCQNATPLILDVTGAGGNGAFSYQWYSNSINSSTGGVLIPGATNTSYSPPTTAIGTRYYYALISQNSTLGCSVNSATATIIVISAPTISQPASSTLCLGGTPAILSITVSGATGIPLYQWFSNSVDTTTGGTAISGATNATFSPPNLTLGTIYYYCIVTLPSGGCSSITSNTANITINSGATINSQPTPTQSLCVGAAIATPLSIAYTGGTGTPSYQWYLNSTNTNSGGTLIPGAINANFTPSIFTTTGTFYYYVVLSLTGNGCGSISSNVAEIVIVPDPIISLQPLATQNVCQNVVSTSLSVGVSGGISSVYLFQWFSNTNNNNTSGIPIAGASTDTYIPPTSTVGTVYYYCVVTQTSGSGCTVRSNTAEVVVNLSPSFSTQPQSSTICIGETPTLLSVSFVNGVGTPTYQWYSNSLNAIVGSTIIAGATNDTYSPPNSAIGIIYYYCVITLPSSGGCSNLTSTIALVTINPRPVIANKTDLICSGKPFTISPVNSGSEIVPVGTSFTWSNPAIFPAGSVTGALAQSIPQSIISQTLINTTTNPAIVTYTVTPLSGVCIGTNFTITVTVNPAISSNVTVINSACFAANNGSIQTTIAGGIPFSPSAPYLISWTGPNGFTSPSANISNLAPGSYTLTITDAGGCPINETYLISEPNEIVLTTILEKDITCFNDANGKIEINISGGTLNYTFAWTKNGIPYANIQNLSNLSPGIYAVTVSDAKNCGPKTATFTITEPPILAVNLVNKTNILCFGDATGVITVNTVGGTLPYTYAWSGPNNFTSSNQNLTAVIAGTYNLIVSDNAGCSRNLTVQLTQTPQIKITATTTPIICYGGNDASISIMITGGIAPYTIGWSNLGSGTLQDNLSAGDYLITITDALNCVQTLNVNIPEAPIFTINPVVKNSTCFGDKNGSINLNLVGGIAPIKLVWDDNATAGTTRNNLGPGSYTVTIIDGKPCTIKRTFIILEPQLLVLQGNITNALDCNNANTGAINLLVSGGSAPFTYAWSNGTTTEDLVNISAGNYLVTVKDANGCSQQAQYSINRPPPIVTAVITKTDFDCPTKFVKQTFVASVSGGVPPYQLVWSSGIVSGPNNEFMNTSQNGTVILNVTDAIGCKSNYPFNVNLPKLGSASFDNTSFAYTNYGNYSINDPIQFTNTATGDFISVLWDFGDGSFSSELNPIHTYINPKDYIVKQTVTYPLGCVDSKTITLTVNKGYVLVVPTAFTPNDDRLNDAFRPVTKGLKNIRLDVYDTWGSLIYAESGDVLRGWDGKIKSSNAENGNYYCKVSGETFYGTIVNENHPFVLIK